MFSVSPEADACRRDFTINALFYDPIQQTILDFVGGLHDLERRHLRAVGQPGRRFLEDHLRLLRAIRFAARTGFQLEADTQHAVRTHAGLVHAVSAERTGQELMRMFSEGSGRQALDLLDQTGLLIHVLPEVCALKGVPQPEEFHPEGDVYVHTRMMLELLDQDIRTGKTDAGHPLNSAEDRETLAFATLCHDLAKPRTISVTDRIRFHDHDMLGADLSLELLSRLRRPNLIGEGVASLIRRHMHFAHLKQMKLAKLRHFLQDARFPLHLELHRMDCLSSHGDLRMYEFGVQAWKEELARPPILSPLIGGRDLMAIGYKPGPEFSRILSAVAEARLEGEFESADAAREWVKRNFPH
jgi:poly(A) polymerase